MNPVSPHNPQFYHGIPSRRVTDDEFRDLVDVDKFLRLKWRAMKLAAHRMVMRRSMARLRDKQEAA